MKLSIPVCSRFIFCQWLSGPVILSETTALYIPTHCFSKKLFSQSTLCSPHMTSFLMPFSWLLCIGNYKWSLSNDHKAHSIDPIIHIGNWNKIMGWEVSWEYGNSCTSFHKLLTSIGSPPVGAIVGAILAVVVVVVLGITTGLIACR